MNSETEYWKERARLAEAFIADIDDTVNDISPEYGRQLQLFRTRKAWQKLAQTTPPKDEWISVDDRLPTKEDADENGKVLVYRDMNDSQRGLSKSIYDFAMVKHCDTKTSWRPLPPSPNT